jgi:hypothetical protein
LHPPQTVHTSSYPKTRTGRSTLLHFSILLTHHTQCIRNHAAQTLEMLPPIRVPAVSSLALAEDFPASAAVTRKNNVPPSNQDSNMFTWCWPHRRPHAGFQHVSSTKRGPARIAQPRSPCKLLQRVSKDSGTSVARAVKS